MTIKRGFNDPIGGALIGRSVDEILLLQGLPSNPPRRTLLLTQTEISAGKILAHELMHAHLFLEGFPSLRDDTEEGLSEFVAYAYLSSFASENVFSMACSEFLTFAL